MMVQASSRRLASALRRKIRRFYDHLNRRDFEWCYFAIAPTLRESPASVTPYQYMASLKRFLDRHGMVRIIAIEPISLHLNESNRLYNDRDFATALVAWEDDQGEAHKFRERWVRDRRGWWYSRCTGLITVET
jgi:hypothetical protein